MRRREKERNLEDDILLFSSDVELGYMLSLFIEKYIELRNKHTSMYELIV